MASKMEAELLLCLSLSLRTIPFLELMGAISPTKSLLYPPTTFIYLDGGRGHFLLFSLSGEALMMHAKQIICSESTFSLYETSFYSVVAFSAVEVMAAFSFGRKGFVARESTLSERSIYFVLFRQSAHGQDFIQQPVLQYFPTTKTCLEDSRENFSPVK